VIAGAAAKLTMWENLKDFKSKKPGKYKTRIAKKTHIANDSHNIIAPREFIAFAY